MRWVECDEQVINLEELKKVFIESLSKDEERYCLMGEFKANADKVRISETFKDYEKCWFYMIDLMKAETPSCEIKNSRN